MSWLSPLYQFPSHFPIQLLIASHLEMPALPLFCKTAIPPLWVIHAAIYHATSRDHLSCGDSILGTIKPMQLPDGRSLGSVSILTCSRLLAYDCGSCCYKQVCRIPHRWCKSSASETYRRRRGAQVSQTGSGRKGNNVEENEPSSKHVCRLPVLQTALERQSAAVFLMTANLIENPLLCLRANNPVWRGWGTIPWLRS